VRRRLLIVLSAALCCATPATAATGRIAGDPLQPQEWWLAAIGADPAAAPGPGIPITVIDSGVDPTSPEFAARPNTTFLDAQTVDGPGEYHGTAVASLAVAPENGSGIVGVYPQAVFQSFDASPLGQITDATAAQGIVAAARHCPGVISISFGGTNHDPQLADAVLYAVHNGCLIVASAGNGGLEGNPPEFPADYPHVITVGATDQDGAVPPFSTLSSTLDVSAPGVDMVAAVPLSRDPTGYSSGLAGTSFAAPIVSAAAAWIWTLRPTLDATQIFQLLLQSAHDVGTLGWDSASGFGIVNIPAALAAAAPVVDPQEPNDDVDQIKPGALFADGRPQLTTAAKPSVRIAGRIDQGDDPRDLYRIWVPAHRIVRASVAGGDAAARIWGPRTVGVGEGILSRRRDLKGPSIRGGSVGSIAYVEVLLTGRSPSASYVLDVTASKR
jgi:subtilisin family serine protease